MSSAVIPIISGHRSDDSILTDITGGTWTTGLAAFGPNIAEFPLVYATAGGVPYLYAFPGNSNDTGNCRKYNLNTNSWSDIGNPGNRNDNMAAMWDGVDNGYIYLVGGYRGSSYQTNVWKYSISGNTYASMTALAQPTGFGHAFVYNNNLYFIGGETQNNGISVTVLSQPVGGGSWMSRASLSAARMGGGYAWNPNTGKFYISGGSSTGANGGATATFYEYDPTQDAWNYSLANMSGARYYQGAAFGNDGAFYLFGGRNASGTIYTADWKYDFGGGGSGISISAVVAAASSLAIQPAIFTAANITAPAAVGNVSTQLQAPAIFVTWVQNAAVVLPGVAGGATGQMTAPSVFCTSFYSATITVPEFFGSQAAGMVIPSITVSTAFSEGGERMICPLLCINPKNKTVAFGQCLQGACAWWVTVGATGKCALCQMGVYAANH